MTTWQHDNFVRIWLCDLIPSIFVIKSERVPRYTIKKWTPPTGSANMHYEKKGPLDPDACSFFPSVCQRQVCFLISCNGDPLSLIMGRLESWCLLQKWFSEEETGSRGKITRRQMADGKAGMQGSQRDIKTSGMGRMGGRNLSLFCERLKDVKADVVALERKCGRK